MWCRALGVIPGPFAFRTTIWRMARTASAGSARQTMIPTRFTEPEVAVLDRMRGARGNMSRSGYIRWLVQQDAKRHDEQEG